MSSDELEKGYEKLAKLQGKDHNFCQIIDILDINKSGTVDYTEFVQATINR